MLAALTQSRPLPRKVALALTLILSFNFILFYYYASRPSKTSEWAASPPDSFAQPLQPHPPPQKSPLTFPPHAAHARNILPPSAEPFWKSGPHGCAPFPKNHELHFSNTHWQLLQAPSNSSHLTVWLFGAYYDNRPAVLPKGSSPIIRVLGVSDRILESYTNKTGLKDGAAPQIWCQLWIPGEKSAVLVEAKGFDSIWPKSFGRYVDGVLIPYFFECPLPSGKSTPPAAVSLVVAGDQCTKATNKLRVTFEHRNSTSKEPRIAVCVKGLDFPAPEMAERLVEWVELLRLLGVAKIFVYEFDVHPRTKAVLNYYQHEVGILDVAPLTLPGAFPNDPSTRSAWIHDEAHLTEKRQQELVPYNDCLYRTIHNFDYVSLLDVDEVLIPTGKKATGWAELVHQLQDAYASGGPVAYYAIGWTGCFFTGDELGFPSAGVPDANFMLRHVYQFETTKNKGLSFDSVKGLYDTRLTIAVLNHWPARKAAGARNVNDKREYGHLHHFKYWQLHCGGKGHKPQGCKRLECLRYKVDETMLKYKAPLVEAVGKVLEKLGLQQ